MSAMRVAKLGKSKLLIAYTLTLVFNLSVLLPIPAPAISFNSAPARVWGHIYADTEKIERVIAPQNIEKVEGETKSQWQVTFINFPNDAKEAVQYAIDIWSRNFSSKVPINVEAVWEKSSNINTLGSARPGYYFNAFPGAPDYSLWYPSALANALAERDLAPNQKEIFLSINSTPLWHRGTDGQPTTDSYDLVSVVLHEIAHGLGFLSNAEYDKFFGTGYIFQPTPFDAYVQLPDGRTLTDFCSRSAELGKAMLGPLFWSGQFGVSANGGVKPKLYTPNPYVDGSSVTHLDESTFSKSAIDSAMTPNLGPGEVFRSPGPVALGMIDDMMKKPPTGKATGLPSKPLNLKALIGDRYALLTFDSQNCSRIDQVRNYLVTILPDGVTKTYESSPIKITGLKNGKSYQFSVVATNEKGQSEPIKSNSVKPQGSAAASTIDSFSRVTHIAATKFRGNIIVIYGDENTQTLKMATYKSGKWQLKVVRRGVDVGPISICTSGVSNQNLNIFYGDRDREDLIHSTFNGSKWNHETVDGNGQSVQDYRELPRTKTASNVSVSIACAVNRSGVQVFYRDETQGILLGAVKVKDDWVFEIVDGDSDLSNRTTGDVAFNLSATVDSSTNEIYLIYDSVLRVDSNRSPVEGEVRVAKRKSAFPEDWKYQTIDGPDFGNAVAGYATAVQMVDRRVVAAWLVSRGDDFPYPTQISYTNLSEEQITRTLTPLQFGRPSLPLSLDSKWIVFGCQLRLCRVPLGQESSILISGSIGFSNFGQLVKVANSYYFVTSLNRKLVWVRADLK